MYTYVHTCITYIHAHIVIHIYRYGSIRAAESVHIYIYIHTYTHMCTGMIALEQMLQNPKSLTSVGLDKSLTRVGGDKYLSYPNSEVVQSFKADPRGSAFSKAGAKRFQGEEEDEVPPVGMCKKCDGTKKNKNEGKTGQEDIHITHTLAYVMRCRRLGCVGSVTVCVCVCVCLCVCVCECVCVSVSVSVSE
jgi:hypothetical protein